MTGVLGLKLFFSDAGWMLPFWADLGHQIAFSMLKVREVSLKTVLWKSCLAFPFHRPLLISSCQLSAITNSNHQNVAGEVDQEWLWGRSCLRHCCSMKAEVLNHPAVCLSLLVCLGWHKRAHTFLFSAPTSIILPYTENILRIVIMRHNFSLLG